MSIDRPAAAVHTDPPFPPNELPGADPSSCEDCGGCTSGRICPCGEEQQVGAGGGRVPPGSGSVGLPAACIGVSRDAPCRGLPPFAFVVLLPRVVASLTVTFSLEVSGFSPAPLLQRPASFLSRLRKRDALG